MGSWAVSVEEEAKLPYSTHHSPSWCLMMSGLEASVPGLALCPTHAVSITPPALHLLAAWLGGGTLGRSQGRRGHWLLYQATPGPLRSSQNPARTVPGLLLLLQCSRTAGLGGVALVLAGYFSCSTPEAPGPCQQRPSGGFSLFSFSNILHRPTNLGGRREGHFSPRVPPPTHTPFLGTEAPVGRSA